MAIWAKLIDFLPLKVLGDVGGSHLNVFSADDTGLQFVKSVSLVTFHRTESLQQGRTKGSLMAYMTYDLHACI